VGLAIWLWGRRSGREPGYAHFRFLAAFTLWCSLAAHNGWRLVEASGSWTAWLPFAVLAGGLVPLVFARARRRFQPWISGWTVSVGAIVPPSAAYMIRTYLGWLGGEAQVFIGALAACLVCIAVAGRIGAIRVLFVTQQRLGRSFAAAGALGIAGVLICLGVSEPAPRLPAPGARKASGDRPNIILIVLDTARADHLSVYGYPRNTTPNLRKLAAQSTVFLNAASASNTSLPSHASMFTGLYPSWHGAHGGPRDSSGGRALPGHLRTLPELLAGQRYLTMAVGANIYYLNADFGFSRGFEAFDVRKAVQLTNSSWFFLLRNRVRVLLNRVTDTADLARFYRTAEDITSSAVALLDQAAGHAAPFFLFLNYMDSHAPWLPPAPFDTLFPGKNRDLAGGPFDEVVVMLGRRRPLPHEIRHMASQYDGAIAYLDSHLGRVLATVTKHRWDQNTLIIITSDHGEFLGERNLIGHGRRLYQEVVRVPMVVRFPGEARARVIANPASHVDILPTALEVAGIRPPYPLHGVSLRQLPDSGRREIFIEAFSRHSINGRYVEQAMITDPWKLILERPGQPQMYNWRSDPAESRNLANGPEAKALLERLSAWRQSTRAPAAPTSRLSPETLRRLRSAGYLQ